jgi:hypothetical protein
MLRRLLELSPEFLLVQGGIFLDGKWTGRVLFRHILVRALTNELLLFLRDSRLTSIQSFPLWFVGHSLFYRLLLCVVLGCWFWFRVCVCGLRHRAALFQDTNGDNRDKTGPRSALGVLFVTFKKHKKNSVLPF